MKLLLVLLLAFLSCTSSFKIKVSNDDQVPEVLKNEKTVVLGLENFLTNYLSLVKNKRVGLVTNPSGVNRKLQSSIDLFFDHPDINLTVLFGPEHGIRGNIFAGHKISDQSDPKTGLPVLSLYGTTRKPTQEMLEKIDVIVFDIQDIGIRSYTYIATMGALIEAVAENNKEILILDRPNPLGGMQVEGSTVQDGFYSFVSYYDIAYRHGMTIGEIALMHNSEKKIGAKLTVIPLLEWKREILWSETGLPWVPTSPHVPRWESAMYLATTGTFGELHTLSEGVGYTAPFEIVGAPWIKADEFADALNNLKLPGVIFRPTYFTPYYFRLKDQNCQGVQLHITDFKNFKSFSTGLHIMKTHMDLYPDHNLFENENRLSSFNKVMGSESIKIGLQNGKTVQQLENEWQKQLNNFKQKRKKYLLYNNN